MDVCDATQSIRIKVLPFVLKDDALDEYNQNLHDEVSDGKFRSAKGILFAIWHRLETSEFKMENKNLWSSMALSSIRVEGESLDRSFSRLKKKARKLQSRLGGDYKSDGIFCDFFCRALQDEPFWMHVDDSDPKITSEVLFSKISLAIQRYQRETDRPSKHSETMHMGMTNRRFARPDRKRLTALKNPNYKDGSIMECTGCGSKNHFYKDCTNPNRAAYRERKLEEIRSMGRNDQKK